MNGNENLVIELIVNNHPGVMSHITGLFSRRNFNLDGILCGKIDDGATSRMYLLVRNDELVEQIIKQLKKLCDVIEVKLHHQYNTEIFDDLDKLLLG